MANKLHYFNARRRLSFCTRHRKTVLIRGNIFTCQLKHFAMFNQPFLHTNQTSYFGRQLLNSFLSDEFGKKEDREIENASWCRNGTDPAPPFPLRITYTARPYHDMLRRIKERQKKIRGSDFTDDLLVATSIPQ
uniref:Uncharacterized protein n=1 Tax=Heterorhabditis bacteriophora TaxID=37862 RepID=A0A1I7WU59_HETBA